MFKNGLSVQFIILIFIIGVTFNACSYGLENLSTTKAKLIDYYENGTYEKEMEMIINQSIEKFEKIKIDSNSVVVFDIDETILSNYPHIKEVDFAYIPPLWDQWVESADAPAIKQSKKLYDYMVGRGCKIVLITGRKEKHYDATLRNLKTQGFHSFDTLITRSSNDNGTTAVEYKSAYRKKLTEQGYSIIGNVGDQLSDLKNGNSGLEVKFPNYLYRID